MNITENKNVLPQAVILAGGKGMRLRPLTEDLPKPLLPVGGQPLIMRILDDLESEGCRDALVLTGYKGEMIENALRARGGEMRVRCFTDDGTSGSAGSLRKAEGLLEDCFFVVSGDLYGKRRYGDFYRFFAEKNAQAAILLTRTREPSEFGVLTVDGEGRVCSFVEKPRWSQVFSDTVNAGIYLFQKELLSFIPRDAPFDVGGGLLPALLKAGVSLYGYDDGGLWRDVGDLATYLSCCLAENGGKSVMMEGVTVEEGARVVDSVLFEGVRVGRGSSLTGCVIGRDSVIGEECLLPVGTALGSCCRVGDGAVLEPGTVLPPHGCYDKKAGGARVSRLFSPGETRVLFSSSDIPFHDLPAGFSRALAAALAAECGGGRIDVYCAPEEEARAAMHSFAKELLRYGRCGVCGDAFPAMVSTLASDARSPLSLYFSLDLCGRPHLSFYDACGMPPPGDFLRRLRDGVTAKREKKSDSSFVGEDRAVLSQARYDDLLTAACGARLSGMRVGIAGKESAPANRLTKILLRLGAGVCREGRGDVQVRLSEDGRRARVYDESGVLDRYHLLALLLTREKEKTGKIDALPFRLPQALFALSAAGGRAPEGFPLTPADGRYDKLRAKGARLSFLYDGCVAVAAALPLLRSENCRAVYDALPPFAVMETNFDCSEDEKTLLLTGSGGVPAGEGVAVGTRKGRARLQALDRRGMLLQVEAARESDCRELLEKARRDLGV
ncbi:MAG: NDP-sugar synthase [Clostridia bacterium]|nr:NDP-sugar synthase [Clostridia bacterium]